jgi:uncharacterized protein YbjQ (UPF0145 family)
MWKCPKCGEQVEASFEVCWNCGTATDGTEDPDFNREDDAGGSEAEAPAGPVEASPNQPAPAGEPRRDRRLIVTTTPSVEGRRIVRYCGLVTGEAILGANAFKDFFASITDVVGGRSASYEGELRRARDIAVAEMEQAASDLGANAVVGVDLDYETVGQTGTMLMVAVSGTAVVVE